MVDVSEGREEEEENGNEAEEDGALLPMMDWDTLNLAASGSCGNNEEGRPVRRAEAAADVTAMAVAAAVLDMTVAGTGFVGDGVSAPDDFWWPSALPGSWEKTAPPRRSTCRQISSVICIWWICRCCSTRSSSSSTDRVGGTPICPAGGCSCCSSGGLEAAWCCPGLEPPPPPGWGTQCKDEEEDDEEDEEEEVVVVAELPICGDVMVACERPRWRGRLWGPEVCASSRGGGGERV